MSLEHSPERDGGSAPLKPLSVTVPTALSLTGLGRTKFYALVAQGRIRTFKVGARTLVNYGDLERLASGAEA